MLAHSKSTSKEQLTTSEIYDTVQYAINVLQEVVKRKSRGDRTCQDILKKVKYATGECAQCGKLVSKIELEKANNGSDFEYCRSCIKYV